MTTTLTLFPDLDDAPPTPALPKQDGRILYCWEWVTNWVPAPWRPTLIVPLPKEGVDYQHREAVYELAEGVNLPPGVPGRYLMLADGAQVSFADAVRAGLARRVENG